MSLRDRETETIARFLTFHADKLAGRVLDLGCGHQPYRQLIEECGGTYFPFDRDDYPGTLGVNVGLFGTEGWRDFDAVVMTQVWQYMPIGALQDLLYDMAHDRGVLAPGGWLLATGPTNWPVVEHDDLWRFTPGGVLALLAEAGFLLIQVEPRHLVIAEGEKWLCGWGVAARSEQ